MRCRYRLYVVVGSAAVIVAALGPSAVEAASLPEYSGSEWNDLINRSFEYAPNLDVPGVSPYITGDPALDSKIWQIAFDRGYELRPVAGSTLPIHQGFPMQPDTADAWEQLQVEAAAAGHSIVIHSGYRSISVQRSIFNKKLSGTSDFAINEVLKYSAPPGASLHHSGYTLDIKVAGGTIGGFKDTEAYGWIQADNYAKAKEFGFVPSYPPGVPPTGPVPEPWEFTYVGDLAIACGIEGIGDPAEEPALRACPAAADLEVGDFSGDQLADIAVYDGLHSTWAVQVSSGTSFSSETWANFVTSSGWGHRVSGDFDGDGDTDIGNYHNGTGNWVVSKSTGSSFSSTVWATYTTKAGWTTRLVGDFDGDGRDDIANYHPGTGNWVVSKSTGSNFESSVWATYTTKTGWTTRLVGDFDGDGRDDIANYHPGTGNWVVSKSAGSNFESSVWATYTTKTGWTTRLVGDFGGDGRDDIANYHPGTGNWVVSKSTGSNFESSVWATYTTKTGWTTRLVGDFDGDGRDDIANYHPGSGNWVVARSTGSEFTSTVWTTFTTKTGWTKRMVGDFNGDGRDDIANYHPGSGNWVVALSSGSEFNNTTWLAP